MRMRRLASLPGLVLLILALTGCSDGGRTGDADTLVVYSAGPRPLAERITEEFTAREDVRVELFAATTGQVMARLEAERYRPRADVVIFASRVAAEALKVDGRLLPYPSPDWLEETHLDWHDPDQFYFATSAAIVGMAFHADAHHPSADWKPLFNGEIPGRFTMPSPSRSGAAGDFLVAYALVNGDAAFADFARARRQGLDFAAANSQAISTLLVGAFQGMVGAVDYLIFRQIADGAPLVMHYPDGGSALVERPIVILDNTPVPDLARSFVDFYFSADAQQIVAEMHLLPARTDTAVSEVRANTELPALLEVDVSDALEHQDRILRRFQIEIERAEVLRGDP